MVRLILKHLLFSGASGFLGLCGFGFFGFGVLSVCRCKVVRVCKASIIQNVKIFGALRLLGFSGFRILKAVQNGRNRASALAAR